MGAWSHSPRDPDIQKEEFGILLTEYHRWFDYWLKDIDNGIMDEPPIYYHVMNAHKDNAATLELSPPPTVTVYRSGEHRSYAILPVIEANEERIAGVEYSFLLIVLTVLVVILEIFVKKKISQGTSADK